MKKIGLVGGISWVSTADYYRFVNEGVNEKLGGLHFAECVVYSLNFGDVQAKTWEHSFPLLLDACISLKKSGVDAIALCANTAHLFADRLQAETGLPLIHIGTETAKAVRAAGVRKTALLGTKFTMEMAFYREKLEANGLQILVPDEQQVRDYIQHTVKEELGRGIIRAETRRRYVSIVEDMVARGAEGVILGCTEIPLLLSQQDFAVPVFDTTRIHSQAIVDYLVS